jgi:hypothetical protein
MMKTWHWANTAAAILMMGSMGPLLEELANPAPELKTSAWNSEDNVAMLMDKPSSAVLHETGQYGVHERVSDLDQVFIYVSNPELAIAPDTAENYIGKVTVNARSSHKHVTH